MIPPKFLEIPNYSKNIFFKFQRENYCLLKKLSKRMPRAPVISKQDIID